MTRMSNLAIQSKPKTFMTIMKDTSSTILMSKTTLLNKAGKRCFDKSVISSSSAYAMQTFWLPQSVCDHVDKSISTLIWSKQGHSRGWHVVSWKEMVKPKCIDGFGIRSARENNIALLGKLVASFMEELEKLWVRILMERYVNDNHNLKI